MTASHLESVTSDGKSNCIDQCMMKNTPSNSIPIQFETMNLRPFLKSVAPATTGRTAATAR